MCGGCVEGACSSATCRCGLLGAGRATCRRRECVSALGVCAARCWLVSNAIEPSAASRCVQAGLGPVCVATRFTLVGALRQARLGTMRARRHTERRRGVGRAVGSAASETQSQTVSDERCGELRLHSEQACERRCASVCTHVWWLRCVRDCARALFDLELLTSTF